MFSYRLSVWSASPDFPIFAKNYTLRMTYLMSWRRGPEFEPGIFIIDALDASRGGASEAVIASLIELAVTRLGERWSVVASIRTFDLLNGRRFRDVMRGEPPNTAFAEEALKQVRHFRIPRLSDRELSELASASPRLGELVTTAPPKLKALLPNIFNLSLAAELIESGVAADSIRTLTTQSELIDRYEDERLSTQPLKLAAAATIDAMVQCRRLTVPQINVRHDALDDILQTGVLIKAGDLVAFAHHVLFDHVAGRFYLAWSEPQRLQRQVSGDSTIGLLLGPALRFAMERIWQNDKTGRPESWGTPYRHHGGRRPRSDRGERRPSHGRGTRGDRFRCRGAYHARSECRRRRSNWSDALAPGALRQHEYRG